MNFKYPSWARSFLMSWYHFSAVRALQDKGNNSILLVLWIVCPHSTHSDHIVHSVHCWEKGACHSLYWFQIWAKTLFISRPSECPRHICWMIDIWIFLLWADIKAKIAQRQGENLIDWRSPVIEFGFGYTSHIQRVVVGQIREFSVSDNILFLMLSWYCIP